ncbi:MAG: 5'/3'-nucleotidase SurE [Sulfurimonas sp.]|uniref:5'/3'-nucleotidase SurE n=1 Tax=Sulfurimonas sp. TaxID=2022749 RepID=UPI002602E221|nr:5'/3'-nucleotidase SurE [Sulfurimonas sp.]MCW8895941.1 5'/3'-nucleotidase SurE [Sulfurimonas sp.]MCW8953378.1 5'/3'-nucleotidase SurE [Sulfurimonas sp.]MCW9068071.1 5'/3'-nucleotidase SurE [Sulfurimonas sp.]
MKNKYRILITNDDGYEAKGLLSLIEALKEIEDVKVTVVAPANEKSACGHSLTLVRPLKFVGVGDDFYKLDDGTPSDCVYLSLSTIFVDSKPDLLISGINRGSNMGEDITYSGTAAGAMEGVLHDIPSIAISQVMDFTDPEGDFTLAKETIKKLVLKIKEGSFPLPAREFLNVNIPAEPKEAKMQITYAGYRFYANDSHVHRNPRGEEHYWLGLHPLDFSPREGNSGISDYEAIKAGNISITPIQLDMSAYKSMDRLQEWMD